MKKLFLILLIGCVCVSLISCKKKEESKTYWKLPNRDKVVFYHSSPSSFWGSDHNKNLELIDFSNGATHHLKFGGGHSGYENVVLRISEDGSIIWIVDLRSGQIGAALNLKTKLFQEEGIHPIYDKPGVELFGVKMYNSSILKPE